MLIPIFSMKCIAKNAVIPATTKVPYLSLAFFKIYKHLIRMQNTSATIIIAPTNPIPHQPRKI